jgi:N-acetylmuramic acid 6-phosphate etherase
MEADLDLRSTREPVRLMNEQDASGCCSRCGRRRAGSARRRGRGAPAHWGTAALRRRRDVGRLAALDARECEARFGLEPGLVVALAAADDAGAGRSAVADRRVGAADAVVALSASGRTPFVLAPVRSAAAAAACTPAVVCVEGTELGAMVNREITIVVGAEVLADSTRLKAGGAQKQLVLNTLSTAVMCGSAGPTAT